MASNIPTLVKTQDIFINNKNIILKQWMSYDAPKKILQQEWLILYCREFQIIG